MNKDFIIVRSVPEPNTGCWLWTSTLNDDGYGVIQRKGPGPHAIRKSFKFFAHRKSYELFNGRIPKGLLVLHKCDVPACVNPDHLWVGTNLQNSHDAREKGRLKPGRHLYRDMKFCKRGHEFTEKNTFRRRGSRECRMCKNLFRSDRR